MVAPPQEPPSHEQQDYEKNNDRKRGQQRIGARRQAESARHFHPMEIAAKARDDDGVVIGSRHGAQNAIDRWHSGAAIRGQSGEGVEEFLVTRVGRVCSAESTRDRA